MPGEQFCLDQKQLRGLQEGALSEADQAVVIAHLDVCSLCRERLDRLDTRSDFLEGIPADLKLGASRKDPLLEWALAELKARPPAKPADAVQAGTSSTTDLVNVDWPRPPLVGPEGTPGFEVAREERNNPGGTGDFTDLSFLGHSDDPRSLGKLVRTR